MLEDALLGNHRPYQLNILNTGTPTRISYNTEFAIDLSIVTTHLSADFIWTVATSSEDSDHFLIFITKMMNVRKNEFKLEPFGI